MAIPGRLHWAKQSDGRTPVNALSAEDNDPILVDRTESNASVWSTATKTPGTPDDDALNLPLIHPQEHEDLYMEVLPSSIE
eukprot:m.266499 g.266499  ORF g.266499 m.266499 type:complete len:81 (-) comp19276_c0_seq3:26-268(-)